jgi:hypothetical protein
MPLLACTCLGHGPYLFSSVTQLICWLWCVSYWLHFIHRKLFILLVIFLNCQSVLNVSPSLVFQTTMLYKCINHPDSFYYMFGELNLNLKGEISPLLSNEHKHFILAVKHGIRTNHGQFIHAVTWLRHLLAKWVL